MITLQKINAKNVWEIVKLKVKKEQEDFVAPNDLSIVEAYAAEKSGGSVLPLGVYENNTPIGFAMVCYGEDPTGENVKIAKGNYCICRLMIDEKYQGKGYGKETLRVLLDFVATYPLGKAEWVYLSYEPENEKAKAMYHSFGFEENGEVEDGETVAVRRIERREEDK